MTELVPAELPSCLINPATGRAVRADSRVGESLLRAQGLLPPRLKPKPGRKGRRGPLKQQRAAKVALPDDDDDDFGDDGDVAMEEAVVPAAPLPGYGIAGSGIGKRARRSAPRGRKRRMTEKGFSKLARMNWEEAMRMQNGF